MPILRKPNRLAHAQPPIDQRKITADAARIMGIGRTTLNHAYQAPDVADKCARIVPLGRVALPEDIADVIVYLASVRAASGGC